MIVAVFLIIDFFVKKHYQSYDDVIIGKIKYNFPRKGILFCMRNDKEAYYSSEAIDKLRAKLSPIPTKLTDTYSKLFYRKIQKNREQVLNNKFKEFQ